MIFDRFEAARHLDVDESVRQCPVCGLRYDDFRTGLTYQEVWQMFWVTSADSADWKYKRRNTVLGKWHELKKNMWVEHLYVCASLADDEQQA